MEAHRFLVFVRSDRHAWMLQTCATELASAVGAASRLVDSGQFDRAEVFEVSGVDAVPAFTYRYGAKK